MRSLFYPSLKKLKLDVKICSALFALPRETGQLVYLLFLMGAKDFAKSSRLIHRKA